MESAQVETKHQQQVLKVLIADDDTPTRILLRAAISQWGYQVIEAKDGEEAWNIMQQPDAPHLFILDWLMPKMDGPTLCERSKLELHYPHYIILLTQVTGTTNIIKGLEAGADEFLSKPFNMAELRSRLSTGARIIQYQNRITQQYERLQSYINQLQALVAHTIETAKILYDSCLKDTTVNSLCFQQVETIRTDLDKLVSVLKNLQDDANIRDF